MARKVTPSVEKAPARRVAAPPVKSAKISEPPAKVPAKRGRASGAVRSAVPEPVAKTTATPAPKGAAAKAASKTSAALVSGRSKTVPKAPPVAPKPVVLTLKHLAAEVGEALEMERREAEGFAVALVERLLLRVKDGAKVKLAGFGVIQIVDRPARTGRNPATGATVEVEASRKVVFRMSKALKEAV